MFVVIRMRSLEWRLVLIEVVLRMKLTLLLKAQKVETAAFGELLGPVPFLLQSPRFSGRHP